MTMKIGTRFFLMLLPFFLGTGFAASKTEETGVPAAVGTMESTPTEKTEGPMLQEVLVTAPMIGEATSKWGDRVATVDSQQIDQLGARDMADALRRVPGVSIARYDIVGSYGGASGGTMYIRGRGASRPGGEVGTLLDGIPCFNGVWSHPLLDTFSVDTADRLEVYKDAQPVLFGNDSYGAVNLVPKSQKENGFSGRVYSSLGQYNTYVQRLEQGGKDGRWDYYLTGGWWKSDGDRKDADGRVGTYSGRAGYDFGEGIRLDLYSLQSDGWADDPGPLGSPYESTPRFHSWSRFSTATLSVVQGPIKASLKGYYDKTKVNWMNQYGSLTDPENVDTWTDNNGLRLKTETTPWEGGSLIVGYDHDLIGGRVTDATPTQVTSGCPPLFRNRAPYALAAQTFILGSGLKITPSVGGRFNDSLFFKDLWGWQAGLTVERGDTQVYGRISRSFNYPGMYVAYDYDVDFNLKDQWASLGVETSRDVEAGVSRKLGMGITGNVTFFENWVANALRFIAPPPPPPMFAAIGNYRTRGTEVSLQGSWKSGWSAFLGMTYQDPKPSSGVPVPDAPPWALSGGIEVPLQPRMSFHADAQWMTSQWVLNPRYQSTGTQMPEYYVLNIRMTYALTGKRPGVGTDLFISGENVTSKRYAYQVGYPMPEALLMTGVDCKF